MNVYPLNDSCNMFWIFWNNKTHRQKIKTFHVFKVVEVKWWFDKVDALYINIGPWAGRFFSFQRQMAGTPYNLNISFTLFSSSNFNQCSELNSIPHLEKQITSKIGLCPSQNVWRELQNSLSSYTPFHIISYCSPVSKVNNTTLFLITF